MSYPQVCRWVITYDCPNFIMTSKNSFKEIPIVLRKMGSVIPEAKGKLHVEPSLRVRKEWLRGHELLWAKLQPCWVPEASLCLRSLTVA